MPQSGGKDSYDPAIAADVCALISTRTESLESILKSDSRFPQHPSTFYRWMLAHAELRELYARVKNEQLEILADEIIPIADTTQIGEIVTQKADGSTEIKTADMLEHRKLRIDSRKWLLAKLNPKKYGDRVQQDVNLSGELQIAERLASARKRK